VVINSKLQTGKVIFDATGFMQVVLLTFIVRPFLLFIDTRAE